MKKTRFDKKIVIKSSFLVCALAALVGYIGCGGGEAIGLKSSAGSVSGFSANGAPIVEGSISIYDANGSKFSEQKTSEFGAWSLTVSAADKAIHPFPWTLKGVAANIPTVWSTAYENNIGVVGQSDNINPFTAAALAAIGVNVGD